MRSWLKVILTLVAVVALLLASLPWWVAVLLPGIARRLHAEYGSYRRLGYGRFAVERLVYRKGAVEVDAARVEADTPMVWLWHHWRGEDRPVEVEHWTVTLTHPAAPSPRQAPTGVVPLQGELNRLADRLEEWIPRGELRDGTVGWPTGGFRLEEASWDRGTLDFGGFQWREGVARGQIRFESSGAIALEAAEPDRSLAAGGTWTGPELALKGTLWAQPFVLHGRFGASGWVPETAEMEANGWNLPLARFAAGRLYAQVQGDGVARWAEGRFRVLVHAQGKPVSRSAPPLRVDVAVGGDRHAWSVESFIVETPFAQARLSAPIQYAYRMGVGGGAAELKVTFDLSQWAELGMAGKGTMVVAVADTPQPFAGRPAGIAALPKLSFDARADGLAAGKWSVTTASLAGDLVRGTLHLAKLAVAAPEVTVAANATVDLVERRLSAAHATVSLTQKGLGKALPGVAASAVSAELDASGPFTAISHSGTLRLSSAHLGQLAPIDATLAWSGEASLPPSAGLRIKKAQLRARCGGVRADVRGSATRSEATLSEATVTLGSAGTWRLTAPAEVSWSSRPETADASQARERPSGPPSASPKFRVGVLSFHGPGGSRVVFEAGSGERRPGPAESAVGAGEGGFPSPQPTMLEKTKRDTFAPSAGQHDAPTGRMNGRGAFQLHLTEFPTKWIRSIMATQVPDLLVHRLDFAGGWKAGWLAFDVSGQADLFLPETSGSLAFAAKGRDGAFTLDELVLAEKGHPIATARGVVPVGWSQAGPRFRIQADEPMEIEADTSASSPLWSALARRAGLVVEEPNAQIRLHGTLNRPTGDLNFSLARVAPLPGRIHVALPSIDHLELALQATPEGLSLESFQATFAGQSVRASGQVPIPSGHWREWVAHPANLWTHATGRLEIADGPVAPWSDAFPSLLAPRGTWGVHLSFANGAWNGALALHGVSLRPIAPLGLIQDISGEVLLDGRTVRIPGLQAQVGGQTAVVKGVAEFAPGSPPRFAFSLSGKDIPVVRQPGFIVRADLDLVVDSGAHGTAITGTATVGDAIMVGDLADLVPSGQAGAPRPPPYFSIATPPLSAWTLDVRMTADHTLKVRTAIFTGTGSADFRLIGTLADPRAVGQVTLDDGQISLPFATLGVQFGAVRLTADDPYHPQIDANASGSVYDYEVRMQARGPAEKPILTFSSNPPLPSDQVLALVMTGKVPAVAGTSAGSPSPIVGFGAYIGEGLLAGSGPGSNRLSVVSGQQLSLKGKPTYDIEYRLAKDWWLVGQYDQFDEYNAGIKWRFLNQGGRK